MQHTNTTTSLHLDAWHEATTKRAPSVITPWGTEASHVLTATVVCTLAGAITLFRFVWTFSGWEESTD